MSVSFTPAIHHVAPLKSELERFDEFYKDLPNLNLVSVSSAAKTLNKSDLDGLKKLDLWVSHRGEMIAAGYLGGKIVFISYTQTSDLLASRRVFESLNDGVFFRYVDNVSDGLVQCKVSFRDMACMARVSLTGFETNDFKLDGSLAFDLSKIELNGRVFGNIVLNLAGEIGAVNKGNSDVMIARLAPVLEQLDNLLDDESLSDETRRERAAVVAKDWTDKDSLFLSKRPKVRQLYSKIKLHPLLQDVTLMTL